MAPIVAVLLIIVAGFPLALALTRAPLLALVIAPLISTLTSAAATILMLLLDGPLLLWTVALLLAQYALIPILRKRVVELLPYGSWADVLWLVGPLLPPLLLVLDLPMKWDSHSIWWLHAAYFTKGGEVARAAIENPTYAFSHTDYPPLPSAPVAAVWAVLPDYDFYVAQFVSALVTFSAIVVLAYAVRRATGAAPAGVSRLAGVAVGLAAWSVAWQNVSGGYSDALWAAAFVAGAVLLLFAADGLTRPTLPLLLLTVAGLSKNEGFVTVVVLAALVTVKERRNLRLAWRVWLPVAAGLSWSLIARLLGAQSDLVAGGQFHQLLTADPVMLDRFQQIFVAMARISGPIVAISLGVALLGVLFLRRARRELGIGSDLWLWAVNVAYAASLVLTYLITPHDLTWHLGSSVDRVSLPLILMACASAACWGAAAVGRRAANPGRRGGRRPGRSPARAV
ncbi:hypothetical protein ACIBF5_12805 [Micromonospora sp. NPDC050417]|uniref:hypothetical protein n=1 Tax=Micromonospora sp. NPDC050417 TaxID=3364280 RepID=UPI0037A13953